MTTKQRDFWIGRNGVIEFASQGKDDEYIGAFGRMTVPDDTKARAQRLSDRFGINANEYIACWCDYNMLRAYKEKLQTA